MSRKKALKICYAGVFTNISSDRYRIAGFKRAGIAGFAFDYREAFRANGVNGIIANVIIGVVEYDCNVLMINKGELFTCKILDEIRALFPDLIIWIFYGDMRDEMPAEITVLAHGVDALLINNHDEEIYKNMRRAGFKKVVYHHTAVDENVFYRRELIQQYDIAFFGSNYNSFPLSAFRRDLIVELSKKFNTVVFGNGWRGVKVNCNVGVYGEDFALKASHAKLTIGVNAYDDALFYTSNRIFNSMACAPHVSHFFYGIDQMFVNNKHLIWFHTIDECISVCERLLENEEARRLLYENGRSIIVEKHTYTTRAKQLLKLYADWK